MLDAAPTPSLAVPLSVLTVAGCLWLRWSSGAAWPLVDVEVFSRAARALTAGHDLYSNQAGVLPFTYPPFAAVAFLPLGWAGATGAAWIVSCASALAYAAAIGISARCNGVPARTALLVGVGGLALEPVVRTVVLGQVNLILMAIALVDVFIVPTRCRGLLTGIAAGVKLTPAIWALYFAVRRDWGSTLRCAVSFGATMLVGFILAPGDSRAYWRTFLGVHRFGDEVVTPMNQSLRALLGRALGVADPPSVWILFALGICLMFCATAALVQLRAREDLASFLCLVAGSLLMSPVSWTHHWVWIVPALLVLIGRGWSRWAWFAGLIFFLAPMWAVPMGEGNDLRLNDWQVVVSGSYILMALLFLSAMCFPWRRPAPAGSTQYS